MHSDFYNDQGPIEWAALSYTLHFLQKHFFNSFGIIQRKSNQLWKRGGNKKNKSPGMEKVEC